MKMMYRETRTPFEKVKDSIDITFFKIKEAFMDWIWPAYKIRRLFDRHDIVKLHKIKPTQYSDVAERMYEANMELIKYFIEEEKPEEHVLWYKDENGEDAGHKYGEDPGYPVMYPEYDGMFIMDIIKMVYKWYTEDEPAMKKEEDYLLDTWYKWLSGRNYSVPADNGYYVLKTDMSGIPTSLDFFEGKDIDWTILDKYLDGDRNNILKNGFILEKLTKQETLHMQMKRKMLHLCTEVREYLWT